MSIRDLIVLTAAPLTAAAVMLASPASASQRGAGPRVPSGHGLIGSTSPRVAPAAPKQAAAVPDGSTVITFSEFPVGTSIEKQYVPRGIRFGGSSPFIADDASNPTSPVLSGTPTFNGPIKGSFVRPNGDKRTVGRFSVDVGFIDNPGSVEVTAFSRGGKKLKTVKIQQLGIVTVTIAKHGIASFRVAEVSAEAAGFAIDNVTFPRVRTLAALGDSYSSGEGNPPFIAKAGKCDRSDAAWPVLIGKRDPAIPDVTDIACSGAESSALTGKFKKQPAQISQLMKLRPRPDIITLTIGGNDVGFSDVLTVCRTPLRNCAKDGRLKKAATAIKNEFPTLVKDYTMVQSAAPAATLVVVGYPDIFPATKKAQGGRCGWLANDERAGLNKLADQLNQTEKRAARAAHVQYVPVLGTLGRHELCTKHPWVFPINLLTGGDNRGHPTFPGQSAIEGRVQKALDAS